MILGSWVAWRQYAPILLAALREETKRHVLSYRASGPNIGTGAVEKVRARRIAGGTSEFSSPKPLPLAIQFTRIVA